MSIKDQTTHSCTAYLNQGIQTLTREATSLRSENVVLHQVVSSVKEDNVSLRRELEDATLTTTREIKNLREENITLRKQLHDVRGFLEAMRLQLEPLQKREDKFRRREEETKKNSLASKPFST